jgi:hypothetical protein
MSILVCLPKRSFPLLALVLTATAVLADSSARANLSVSPQIIELNAKRGQAQGTILVSNQGEKSFGSRTYAVPFNYDREQGFQELISSPTDLTPYLQFSPAELTVPELDKRRVRFIARLAPNLPDGEYRAMIFTEMAQPVEVKEVDNSNQTTLITNLLPRIGVAVYVRKGNVSPKLNVDSFQFDAAQQQPQILVKNTGKASAFVGGTWSVKQNNQEIRKGTIVDTTVIAESDRYVKIYLSDSETNLLPPGEYQIEGNLRWGFNQMLTIPYRFPFTISRKK